MVRQGIIDNIPYFATPFTLSLVLGSHDGLWPTCILASQLPRDGNGKNTILNSSLKSDELFRGQQ